MSCESTTRSASFPGSIEPRTVSSKLPYAASRVIVRSASSRVSFWSGSNPPGGFPRSSWRVTVAWKLRRGETSSTGASVPFRMRAPAARRRRHA